MNENQAKLDIIAYWMEKSAEALESAKSERKEGRFVFAVNRAYYACFYAASAVFIKSGEKFRKHAGIRGGVHRLLVKSNLISPSLGKCYDLLFESRQRGNYQELVECKIYSVLPDADEEKNGDLRIKDKSGEVCIRQNGLYRSVKQKKDN